MTMEPMPTRADREQGQIWSARHEELTEWAERRLVNRTDRHGGQFIDAAGKIQRMTKGELTRDILETHFGASRTEHVIGLHSTAPDETCRWVAIDIDAHDDRVAPPVANRVFALMLVARASAVGLAVRLLDSSGGRGGYHVWVHLGIPRPMAVARRLVLWLIRGWEVLGMPRRPDLFPGNDRLTGLRCGNWLRAPGRHHKRASWARVWSPARSAWLDGNEAIDSLLSLCGDSTLEVASIVPVDFLVTSAKRAVASVEISKIAANRPDIASRSLTPGPRPRGTGASSRELRLASEALAHYPNRDLDYDAWLEVGMALRNLEDDGAAFELWDRWSAGSAKHDLAVTEAKWRGLRPANEGGGVGLGTLFHRAKSAGWPGGSVVDDPRGFRAAYRHAGRSATFTIPLRPARREMPDAPST